MVAWLKGSMRTDGFLDGYMARPVMKSRMDD